MRYLFDITHPKQALFFDKIIKELQRRNHEVFVTTRKFGECGDIIKELLKLRGYQDFYVMGSYGGKELPKKLITSAKRVISLTNLVSSLPEIHGIVHLSSPDAARVAYGLQIPQFCFNDIPEAEHTLKLTVPYADWVFSPRCVPADVYKRMNKNVYQYNSLDPILWLQDFKPDSQIKPKLGIEKDFIVFKYTPLSVSFNLGRKDMVLSTVKYLISHYDVDVVGLTYSNVKEVRRKVPEAVVLSHAIDMQSLISEASLLITGGGTMSIEAAWFGVPVVSARPIETCYDKFLGDNGLLFRSRKKQVLRDLVDKWMFKKTDGDILHHMPFPLEEICTIIEKETMSQNII